MDSLSQGEHIAGGRERVTEGEMKEDREKWMMKARERETGDRWSRGEEVSDG